MTDPANRDWDAFESRVVYRMKGEVVEHVPTEVVTDRATEATLRREFAKFEHDEMLYANIINLDSWLHADALNRLPDEYEIDANRYFIPDKDGGVEVTLDVRRDELIAAAKRRAGEDATHFAYVLGDWTYRAKQHDFISRSSVRTLQAIFADVTNHADYDTPDDATSEERGGGRDE